MKVKVRNNKGGIADTKKRVKPRTKLKPMKQRKRTIKPKSKTHKIIVKVPRNRKKRVVRLVPANMTAYETRYDVLTKNFPADHNLLQAQSMIQPETDILGAFPPETVIVQPMTQQEIWSVINRELPEDYLIPDQEFVDLFAS